MQHAVSECDIICVRGQAHSNGKYGFRIFDVYMPDERSVFTNTFVWRNGAVGWTATAIGRVAFKGMIAVQNGHHVFESRQTRVSSWDDCYVSDSLFADYVDPPLPLDKSFSATTDSFHEFEEMGGPMLLGILLPWNDNAGGGMSIRNCTVCGPYSHFPPPDFLAIFSPYNASLFFS